jgi:hypothetical protein
MSRYNSCQILYISVNYRLPIKPGIVHSMHPTGLGQFQIMANYFHGIIILNDNTRRGGPCVRPTGDPKDRVEINPTPTGAISNYGQLFPWYYNFK